MTLTEFLLARIAEDEAVAREAIAMREEIGDTEPRTALTAWPDTPVPTCIIGPERVLIECDAKRQILMNARYEMGVPSIGLRLLASAYADHPDYQPEWAEGGPVPTGLHKQWNQCTECDRYFPCRKHPSAGVVGPVPEEEREPWRWVPKQRD